MCATRTRFAQLSDATRSAGASCLWALCPFRCSQTAGFSSMGHILIALAASLRAHHPCVVGLNVWPYRQNVTQGLCCVCHGAANMRLYASMDSRSTGRLRHLHAIGSAPRSHVTMIQACGVCTSSCWHCQVHNCRLRFNTTPNSPNSNTVVKFGIYLISKCGG
jgi:hypothetical protein